MAKALTKITRDGTKPRAKLDWRKRISDHVAFGLLVYTGLHIFVTMGAIKTTQGSILPYFSLVVLVGAIIPGCRWFEKRWEQIGDDRASDLDLQPAFRRDVMVIWISAIGLPILLTFVFKSLISGFLGS